MVAMMGSIMSAERGSKLRSQSKPPYGVADQEDVEENMSISLDKHVVGDRALSGTAEDTTIGTVIYGCLLDAEINKPVCSVPSGGPAMEPMESMPDEDLFQQDPEQWLKDNLPGLDKRQIKEELSRMTLLSLVEFYESAMEVLEPHPDLLKKLPKVLPVRLHTLPRPQRRMDRDALGEGPGR
jgi:hypothetical protein